MVTSGSVPQGNCISKYQRESRCWSKYSLHLNVLCNETGKNRQVVFKWSQYYTIKKWSFVCSLPYFMQPTICVQKVLVFFFLHCIDFWLPGTIEMLTRNKALFMLAREQNEKWKFSDSYSITIFPYFYFFGHISCNSGIFIMWAKQS